MERSIVQELKPIINQNKLAYLQEKWLEYQEAENCNNIAWDVVYKDIYLHACLKGQHDIVVWLDELYKEFNPITQIALRQMFPYARHLLQKHKISMK